MLERAGVSLWLFSFRGEISKGWGYPSKFASGHHSNTVFPGSGSTNQLGDSKHASSLSKMVLVVPHPGFYSSSPFCLSFRSSLLNMLGHCQFTCSFTSGFLSSMAPSMTSPPANILWYSKCCYVACSVVLPSNLGGNWACVTERQRKHPILLFVWIVPLLLTFCFILKMHPKLQ